MTGYISCLKFSVDISVTVSSVKPITTNLYAAFVIGEFVILPAYVADDISYEPGILKLLRSFMFDDPEAGLTAVPTLHIGLIYTHRDQPLSVVLEVLTL